MARLLPSRFHDTSMHAPSSYDPILSLVVSLLLSAGLFILASASLGLSVARFHYPYYYIVHQIFFGALPGMILLWIATKLHYRLWKQYALPLLLGSIVLMFLVFIPSLGLVHGGARRWINLGPLSLQPSEFLKFSYVVYLAAWLESRADEVGSFKFGFLPFLIMNGFIASFLILQPDIGTLGVLLATAASLFFLSGGVIKQMGLLILLGIFALGILAVTEPYRLDRLTVFLNPSHDPQGVGYQIRQSLIGIGSGGLWGKGFALSRQKFSYLPEPMGDSIFAVAAEELGFIGSAILITLFMVFFLRGIAIARHVPDSFGKLLAAGLILLVIFQAFINIAAISGLLPLTGIPLSFISYGGTALALTLFEIGIILNVSRARI